LLPELAEPLSRADLAIFVDAAVAFGDADRSSERSDKTALNTAGARPPASGMAHTSSPDSLLAMAERLYGARPRTVMVSIPVERFAFGEALSPEAQLGLAAALRRIRALIDGHG
jgi:hydrogenase maturation protease